MKNPEEAIERVLEGLRDTEAPAGMERRILAAFEVRTAVHTAGAPRWAWRVALAGMIAACLIIVISVVQWHGHSSTQAQQHTVAPESPSSVGSAARGQDASMLPKRPIAPIRKVAGSTASTRKVRQISAANAVLLAEMYAPSHPAPEATLTNEEKLLLRAVRLNDPQVMAMLNPEVRARQEAESEAEFQAFVNQSGKGDSE